jgi:hypothetical protein
MGHGPYHQYLEAVSVPKLHSTIHILAVTVLELGPLLFAKSVKVCAMHAAGVGVCG